MATSLSLCSTLCPCLSFGQEQPWAKNFEMLGCQHSTTGGSAYSPEVVSTVCLPMPHCYVSFRFPDFLYFADVPSNICSCPRERLNNGLLFLNFHNIDEKERIAAERNWVIDKTEQPSQPIHYKDMFTLEWKPVIVLRWGMVMLMYLQGLRKYGYL